MAARLKGKTNMNKNKNNVIDNILEKQTT